MQANNKIATASSNAFDVQFNKAIKVGVEKGEFTQPKGKSLRVASLDFVVAIMRDSASGCSPAAHDVVARFVMIFFLLGWTDASPGPSGPVKLAKKEAAPKPAAKV